GRRATARISSFGLGQGGDRCTVGGMVQMKPPREHGFWVMLFIALAVGVAAAPGWLALLSAACLALFSTGLAMWLGRRIRRNAWLQVLSGPSLATLAVPIGVIGGASLEKMLNLYLPVALVFLSTTLAVQAIFYRAQRKQSATQRAEYAALSVSFVAVLISLVWRPAG